MASSENVLYDERPSMRRLKETNGRPKHTIRSASVKAGSPSRGDPYGDGAAIVVRAREESNLVHGEGRQELSSYER